MATTKTTKHDVRLIVSFREDNLVEPYLHLSTEVVYFDTNDQRWVNCSGYSTPEKLRGFEKLGVHAQGDSHHPALYGADVSYWDIYQAKLHDIQRMARTITSVDRKMAKLADEFGYARTAAEVVVRFAKAVGCTSKNAFGYYDKTHPSQDKHGYVWMDADWLRAHIEKRQDEFAEKYHIKPRED